MWNLVKQGAGIGVMDTKVGDIEPQRATRVTGLSITFIFDLACRTPRAQNKPPRKARF